MADGGGTAEDAVSYRAPLSGQGLMRRRVAALLAIALPVAAACGGSSGNATPGAAGVAQAGTPTAANKAADEAALRAIYEKLPNMLMHADTAYFASLFLDDGVEIMPGAPPTQGPAAVTKQFAASLATMKNLNATVGDIVVTVADAGDLAVVKAPYHLTFSDPKGKKMEDHGTTMTIFKKANGQRKIPYDTNISEVAPQ
jgi:uncharacterized protein (TIGR02246 family)